MSNGVNVRKAAPLSDVSGRIEHIFFALPAYDPTFISPLVDCFRGIREALGPGVRCTVLHRASQTALVREQLEPSGPLDTVEWKEGFVLRLGDTSSTIDGGTLRITRWALPDFTSWVQDAFLVAVDQDDTSSVLASPHVRRSHGGLDDEIPVRLAEHLSWDCELLPCPIEAGNVLVDDRVVVVGSDVPAGASAEEWTELCSLLASNGRTVLVPGDGAPQPVFHLDLYLTLAGLHPESGRPCAVVGSVRIARELSGQPLEEVDLEDRLNAVSGQLVAQGYFVERVPLLPFTSELAPNGAWYSYNNSLVEVTDDARRVVLPGYGTGDRTALDRLDAYAADVWARIGFEVRVARGPFAHLAQLGGSVRCMTKVLGRSR
jgi:hypothetical protein